MIDIEKFIVSMLQQLMKGHPLKTNILYALLQQGLVYSDGRIVRIVNTKDGKSLEEAITNEPIITREPDIDIDAMVEKYKEDVQQALLPLGYSPDHVGELVLAYRKRLKDMFNKMNEGGKDE